VIGELFAEVIGKTVIEGVAYGTGKAILYVCSAGQLRVTLDHPTDHRRFQLTFVRDGVRHLNWFVAVFIGLVFWIAAGVVLYFAIK